MCLHSFFPKLNSERALAQVRSGHVRQFVLGPEPLGLSAHIRNQFRPLNSVGKAGEVFNQGGERKLAARFMPFEHKGLQVGTRGVERGSVPGASRSHDDNVSYVH